MHRYFLAPPAATLIAATLIAMPLPARAGDGGDTIVVTGQGLAETPAAPVYGTRRLDRDALLAAPSGRIEDVLANVAGFQQFRRSDSRSANPSAQGVTLRALGGNATSRALVLLDGVPMADPFFGHIPLSALAPERLASARITRGGGAGAFGSGAVAGIIDLTSASADDLDPVSGTALINDRGESELSAALAPRLGQGFAVVSGRWDRGRGFWTTPRGQRGPASVRAGHESWSVGLRAVAPLAPDVELQLRGLAFDDRRTLRFAGADSGASGQDASLRIVGRGRWAFDALAYAQVRDFDNGVISATSFRKVLDQTKTPATGLGGKLELRPPVGGGHVLRLGADWRATRGTMRETAFNGGTGAITAQRRAGGRSSDLGLFVDDDWSLGPVVLTAGARADRWAIRAGRFTQADAAGKPVADLAFPARSGWATSLRGGARIGLDRGLTLRAAGYTGLRMPTLNELYRPFAVFPVTTQANAALRNERLRGFEAGVDLAPAPGVAVSLTGFVNRVRHAIANVTIGPNLRQRRNVDAVRSRGAELDARVALGQLRFDGSLAVLDARVEGSGASLALDGMRPAQTPKIAASATLGWRPAAGTDLAFTLRHAGAQFEDDLETDRLKPATTLDAFASLPLTGGLALVLRAENLTGSRVVTRNQGGSLDLGTPRTLWAGLRLRR